MPELRGRFSLSQEKPEDVLRLIRSENVGPITFFNLISYFGTVSAALDGVPEMARRGGKKTIALFSKFKAEGELELLSRFGAGFCVFGDAHYPKMLMDIHDPPPFISTLGYAHLANAKPNIAIVGARNASANGCHFATRLAGDLGKGKVNVVSGLARGIDTAAHKGSLESGTVAVIAGGIDNIYPPENKALYEAISAGGLILSEQAFGSHPRSQSFPARNRIISGMSAGVVIVEASFKSGSLITAQFAAEQGRDVFAVPGSPLDPRCHGTNDLIRNGAILTESVKDILPVMKTQRRIPLSETENSLFSYALREKPSEAELNEARKLVLEKLGPTPVLVDELLIQCQLTPPIVLPILLELELAGRLIRSHGNRVSLQYSTQEIERLDV